MYTKRSTHRTEIVPVVLEPHPNADTLSVVSIFNGGHKCIVKTEDWKGVSLAAYVVPDSVVDTNREEFSFLKPRANSDGTYRVRAMRLRQVWSEGCLVPAPNGSKLGDDVSELLGVTRYEPPEPGSPGNPGLYLGGEVAKSPPGIFIKYDVESWARHKGVFVEGEEVVVSEKLHGCLKEDTLVLMADGTEKPISRVRPGELVKSYSEQNFKFVDGLVLNNLVRPVVKGQKWLTLTFENGASLTCTADHKVLTKNRGWVEAEDLTLNDDVQEYPEPGRP